MRKFKQIVFFILLSLIGSAYAQSVSTKLITPIKIGDQVPDVFIANIHNYKASQARLSDFKGKLVILDFWGATCSPCLSAFPKMEKLQNKFKDQILVILVNEQTQEKIDSVYRSRKAYSALYRDFPDLPSVTDDTMLSTLFKHRAVPHYVWIDGNRRIRAITGGNEVTSENIQMMLLDELFTLPEKNDFLAFDRRKAILPQVYGSFPDHLKYYSCLLQYVPGLPGSTSRFIVDTLNNTVRITRTGSILKLYADALSHFRSIGDPLENVLFEFGKRVILEVADSTRFLWKEGKHKQTKTTWQYNHWFQYELVLPIVQEEQAYQYYLSDLNKFFKLKGRMEKRVLKCMALVRTSDKDKIRYPSDSLNLNKARTYTDSTGVYHLDGSSLEIFRRAVATANRDKPFVVVDNTGYEGPALLEVHSSLSDIPRLRKELRKKYDLDLIPTEQEVDVMVITEK